MIWVVIHQQQFHLIRMLKNSSALKLIRYPFLYILVATLCAAIAITYKDWIQAESEKIILTTVFLGGLYLLFYFVFLFLQKKHRDQSAFIFLIILMLKFGFILAFLFLFLNPSDAENKREILLFLMTYFLLLIVDIAIKIRLMK